MVATDAQLHSANLDPITSPDLLLLEFWEQGRSDQKERAVVNNEDITSNSLVYPKSAIQIALPSSTSEAPTLKVSVSNIERIIGRKVLSTKLPIICRLMEINAATPDTILRDTYDLLVLEGAEVTAESVSGNLLPQLSPLEPFPNEGVNIEFFPGL